MGKKDKIRDYGIRQRIARIWYGLVPDELHQKISYRAVHPHEKYNELYLYVFRFDDGRIRLTVRQYKDGRCIEYMYWSHPKVSDYRQKMMQEISERMKATRLGGFDF